MAVHSMVGGDRIAETSRNFWQTVPGVITAVAALITALGGVLGILAQNDLLGRGGDAQESDTTQGATGQPGGEDTDPAASGAAAGGPSTDASTLIPWGQATATLVRQDGTSVVVKAPTVGLACDTERLVFENGQHMELEDVRSIEFNAIYMENSSADAVVTLLDGRQMEDPVHTWNCPVTGTNELGSLDIELNDIQRIEFHR